MPLRPTIEVIQPDNELSSEIKVWRLENHSSENHKKQH